MRLVGFFVSVTIMTFINVSLIDTDKWYYWAIAGGIGITGVIIFDKKKTN